MPTSIKNSNKNLKKPRYTQGSSHQYTDYESSNLKNIPSKKGKATNHHKFKVVSSSATSSNWSNSHKASDGQKIIKTGYSKNTASTKQLPKHEVSKKYDVNLE